jgi:hypothetical protein
MKISQIGHVCSLPQVLLRYRLHAENFSKKRSDEQESEANRIVAEGVQYLLGRPITEQLADDCAGCRRTVLLEIQERSQTSATH